MKAKLVQFSKKLTHQLVVSVLLLLRTENSSIKGDVDSAAIENTVKPTPVPTIQTSLIKMETFTCR